MMTLSMQVGRSARGGTALSNKRKSLTTKQPQFKPNTAQVTRGTRSTRLKIKHFHPMPGWRNWQTQRTQKTVLHFPSSAASCFFPVLPTGWPLADSAAATVSGSQDVPLATASDFPRRPGDTRYQSQASCGDNRCGADVGTPADCTRFVEDDKGRVETNDDSKDNGGTGSSRLLRGSWDESLRRIETSSATQACGEKLI